MNNNNDDMKVVCRFSGKVADNLRELQETGNFPSLKATVEHLVGTFSSPMLNGIKNAQRNVELSTDSYLFHGGDKN